MTDEPITVAQAIARYFGSKGSGTAFVVAGGASLHLIHAFAEDSHCQYVPMHHEQSAAMAADGHSRSGNQPGIAIATSGPGATNLLTGIAGCFYDSIPAFFVTGQVSTTRMVGETGVRQIGFQETPIVEMVSRITKAAFLVTDAMSIRRVLEEAWWQATTGRPGPVLIDVPDDIQRERIDWHGLEPFEPPQMSSINTDFDREAILQRIRSAERPILVGGAGVVLGGAESRFRKFAEKWGAPVVLTWGATQLLPNSHPQLLGLFGTHGSRHANLAIQNADLVLSIGSRLDTKATGSPISTFAREATRIMVDIDPNELHKFEHFGSNMDCAIQADCGPLLESLIPEQLPPVSQDWLDYCARVRLICEEFDEGQRSGPGISPYAFMRELGATAPELLDIYVDTGCALPWLMTGLERKEGHRIFHDLNNTAMGWSLPATIGGFFADSSRPSLCVIGDGSLMMAMHDLVTLSALNKQARIVVIDNAGYSMIRQTQDQWLGSRYHSSSTAGGLSFPNYSALAEATGFTYVEAGQLPDVSRSLVKLWQSGRPVMLRVCIDPTWRVIPQVKFGRPNEDMEPLLPRSVFKDLMLVEPLPQSRNGHG